MYGKGCSATGWDGGRAFLHKGESNGGAYPNCTVHSMREVGRATTTKVNTCNVRIDGTCKSRENKNLAYVSLLQSLGAIPGVSLLPTGGGATPRSWTPTTPPTNCWPKAPRGGGGAWRGGSRAGEGGSRGGGGVPRVPVGGGVSGTSEQL